MYVFVWMEFGIRQRQLKSKTDLKSVKGSQNIFRVVMKTDNMNIRQED